MTIDFEPWSTHFQKIINLIKESFEKLKETTLVHFKSNNYPSHNQEKTYQVTYEVASCTTCENQFSNVSHVEFLAYYKMNNMPNFNFLHETKNKETKYELAFQQRDNEEDD